MQHCVEAIARELIKMGRQVSQAYFRHEFVKNTVTLICNKRQVKGRANTKSETNWARLDALNRPKPDFVHT